MVSPDKLFFPNLRSLLGLRVPMVGLADIHLGGDDNQRRRIRVAYQPDTVARDPKNGDYTVANNKDITFTGKDQEHSLHVEDQSRGKYQAVVVTNNGQEVTMNPKAGTRKVDWDSGFGKIPVHITPHGPHIFTTKLRPKIS